MTINNEVRNISKQFRTPHLGFAVLILPLLVGSGSWLWWKSVIRPVQPLETVQPSHQHIQIQEGLSAQEIGVDLKTAGLIRSLTAWKLWTRWSGFWDRQGGFQAGTYALSPQATLPQIAAKVWSGKVVQDKFTIPEGWSLKQMAAYFEDQGWFTAQEFLDATNQVDRARYPWLPPDLPFLEGFLYPDTYQLPIDQRTPMDVVEIMLDRFEQVALPIYNQQTLPSELSLLEWVTLASIVEQEAVIAKERPLIAGVFWNRLQQGIALGADPTVEYGLGVTQTPDQPLTLAQVNTPSPYNTYINAGLPPTPIASPGLASFKATQSPTQTDYLYFVARYDGTHVFSRTLREHINAQARIRDQQDTQRRSAKP